jgi:hypothetical protein
LLAVLVASLLMIVGLNFYVGMFGVGLVTVFFYKQKVRGPIKTATGAGLGALSGFLCFSITSLLSAAATLFPEVRAKLYQQILDNAEKFVAAHPEVPQLQASLTQIRDPRTFIVAIIMGGIFLLIFSTVLGSLGGMVGTLLFRRRERS